MPTRQKGFSLIELSLVLVILALLTQPLLIPLKQQATERQARRSEAALQLAQEALLAYTALTGALPCPDYQTDPNHTDYGLTASTCSAEGWLPFRSLGLREEERIAYWADPAFTRSNGIAPGLNTPPTVPNRAIFDGSGRKLTSDAEPPIAVLFSVGSNHLPDGLNGQNSTPKLQYESHPPSATFDDILIWIGRPALFNAWIHSGQGN